MTAICPAGPPKLSSATRSHTQKASPNLMPWDVAGDETVRSAGRSVMS